MTPVIAAHDANLHLVPVWRDCSIRTPASSAKAKPSLSESNIRASRMGFSGGPASNTKGGGCGCAKPTSFGVMGTSSRNGVDRRTVTADRRSAVSSGLDEHTTPHCVQRKCQVHCSQYSAAVWSNLPQERLTLASPYAAALRLDHEQQRLVPITPASNRRFTPWAVSIYGGIVGTT